MKNISVVQYRDRLDHLFDQASEFEGKPELLAHWSRYLCVLASGLLEVAVQSIFGAYAKDKASPQVAAFVQARLRGFQNPKMGNILELVAAFSLDWRERLEDLSDGEPGDAVTSIVANRHSIAHGSSVGISYVQIERYYKNALLVVDMLEELCEGD